MYGVTVFFNLPHVSDILEANDITFEMKICKGLNLARVINADAAEKVKPEKAPETKAEAAVDSQKEAIAPIQFSHVTALKAILTHILSCKPFWAGALITFLICFVGNIIGCYLAGTLIGDNPDRIYFLRDVSSLINYIFICPVYVGLNCVLINIWLKLKKITLIDEQNEAPAWFKKIPKAVWASIFIALFLLLAIKQEFEMLNPAIYPRLYWYIGDVTDSGERIFGFIGIYYSIYNNVLLFFLLFPFVLFVKLILISKAVIEHLKKAPVTAKARELLKKQLHHFYYGYIVLKLIVVIYIGNACTWKMANPNQSFNYLFMATALTVVGLGLVPFFRYYIKTSMHRLGKSGWINDDIRPSYVTEFAYFLNVLIVLSFVYVCWF